MRKSPTGDADWGGDDELLDGVVRTVTGIRVKKCLQK